MAIDDLIKAAALNAKNPADGEIIKDAIENGLALDPIPDIIQTEYANALGLSNQETKAIIKSVAGPIVGFAPKNVPDGLCGTLHPDPGAEDSLYVAERNAKHECLPKNPQ